MNVAERIFGVLVAFVAYGCVLVLPNKEYKDYLGGALDIVTKIMTLYFSPDDPEAVTRACGGLGTYGFTAGKDVQNFIWSMGALGLGVRAMKRHPENPRLNHACGQMLGGISLFNFEVSTAAGNEGAIGAVVESMRHFPDDREVQFLGSIIGCFCDLVPHNQVLVNQAGGIEVILQAMRKYYWDAEVQFHTYCAFSNNLYNHDNAVWAMHQGGIELAVQTIKDHPPASQRVREEIMQAFRGWNAHPDTRLRLIQAGAPEGALQSMQDAPEDRNLNDAASALLAELAGKVDATYKAHLVEIGAIKTLLSSLGTFRRLNTQNSQYGGFKSDEIWPIFQHLCAALAVFAKGSSSNQALMEEAGAIQEVSMVMQAKRSDHATFSSCCALLHEFVQLNASAISKFQTAGAPQC